MAVLPQRMPQRTAADADAVMTMLLVSAVMRVDRRFLRTPLASDTYCQPGRCSEFSPAHQSGSSVARMRI